MTMRISRGAMVALAALTMGASGEPSGLSRPPRQEDPPKRKRNRGEGTSAKARRARQIQRGTLKPSRES